MIRRKPQAVYEVTITIYGRDIAVVTVPGTSEDDAAEVAKRYLAANIYPRAITESDQPLPAGGRGIRFSAA
jgi:hypothetical protein